MYGLDRPELELHGLKPQDPKYYNARAQNQFGNFKFLIHHPRSLSENTIV